MRVFVFEYLTAASIGRDPADPLHGMYREGQAMRDAVVADFARLPGVEVFTYPDEAAQVGDVDSIGFRRLATASDWTLVIAPESDGILGRFARRVGRAGLLGPTAEAVGLTAAKLALAGHWRANGVRTPATTDRRPTRCEAFPVVWKPRDGAGSTATFLLRDALDVARAEAAVAAEQPVPMILQEYIPGRPASVAFLCGPAGHFPLIPASQLLSDDGRFKYLGGELPIPPELAERAVALASRAVACVPGLLGYVGVDLVLGDAPDGSRDYAIEINPRLTTSYVGLRALADVNLAGAMLAAAAGETLPPLRWKPGRVRFAPDGTVTPAG
ncbi:MAG: ATP-grasp domain-containing protein [Gemmataceae bacterium]|nr:ATP-grasp domain-containing protein [Gemmataceae bacterium]